MTTVRVYKFPDDIIDETYGWVDGRTLADAIQGTHVSPTELLDMNLPKDVFEAMLSIDTNQGNAKEVEVLKEYGASQGVNVETSNGYTIYNEDCIDTMRNKFYDNEVSMVLTSPPYDNFRDYKGYSFDFESVAKELYRIMSDHGVLVWVVGDRTINGNESGTSFKQALHFKDIGFNLYDTMIYHKNTYAMGHGRNRYASVFEYMFVLVKGRIGKTNIIRDRVNKYNGHYSKGTQRLKNGSFRPRPRSLILKKGIRGNIWTYSVGRNHTTKDAWLFQHHPAMFPEALARDHLISWGHPRDIVYDPFAGAGTTLKIARELGMKPIGSEISAEYCNVIQHRMAGTQP